MSWEWIDDSTPKARKGHRCLLCGLTIEKGTKHVKRFGIGDDGKCSFRMHIQCESFTKNWDDSEWEYNEENEFRRDYLGG